MTVTVLRSMAGWLARVSHQGVHAVCSPDGQPGRATNPQSLGHKECPFSVMVPSSLQELWKSVKHSSGRRWEACKLEKDAQAVFYIEEENGNEGAKSRHIELRHEPVHRHNYQGSMFMVGTRKGSCSGCSSKSSSPQFKPSSLSFKTSVFVQEYSLQCIITSIINIGYLLRFHH
ncbi:uncharacterized protein LOC143656990 isoform X2 [Tamandua tetradactyla]|uniref:uncharacterized protein LOC143656990 isoform X2 n=1 Tax=Tamandua tetradactyla TaxID=48850 RepID=UPI0040541D93